MIIAATGHRPEKLGGHDQMVRRALGGLATEYLHQTRPTTVISGMALGWDQAIAGAAIALRIHLVAVVPFVGQELRWPDEAQARYWRLLGEAHEVEILRTEPPFGNEVHQAMQARNEWMVDHCDGVVALHDGSAGGTFNCIRYAEAVGRPVENLWWKWRLPDDVRALLQ